MNQRSSTGSCIHELIEPFLIGDCTTDQEQKIIAHLERCPQCQEKLQQAAGSDQQWMETRQFLIDEEFDLSGNPEFTKGQCYRTNDAEAVQRLIESLSPIIPSDDSNHSEENDSEENDSEKNHLGVLGGHFEIKSIVGVGSMGVVLRANDPSLNRDVAVKVLSSPLAASKSAHQRFAREARAVAAVTHPNVIAIHSVSVHGELPFLVMPLIAGQSLQKMIDQQGPLPLIRLLEIGTQLSHGLAAAHDAGLVHRDVKPANILIESSTGKAVLTDFGLARTVDDSSITVANAIAGTPDYMSPEQASGKEVQQSSDLFSLGSVIYTMATGQTPFRGESAISVLRCVNEDEPIPMQELNPSMPDWLQQTVQQLMAKSPERRPSGAAEVAQCLESFLSHLRQPDLVDKPNLPESWRRNRQVALADSVLPAQNDSRLGTGRVSFAVIALAVVAMAVVGVSLGGIAFLGGSGERSPSAHRDESAAPREKQTAEGADLSRAAEIENAAQMDPELSKPDTSGPQPVVPDPIAPDPTPPKPLFNVGGPFVQLPLAHLRGPEINLNETSELDKTTRLDVICFWRSQQLRTFYALRHWNRIQAQRPIARFVCVSQNKDTTSAVQTIELVESAVENFSLPFQTIEDQTDWLDDIPESQFPFSCVLDQGGNLMWTGPPEGLELALDSIDAENPQLSAAAENARQSEQYVANFADAVQRFDWATATQLLPKVRRLDPLAAGRFDMIGFETRLAEEDPEPAFDLARRMHHNYPGQPQLISTLARRLTDKCFKRLFDQGQLPDRWTDDVLRLATDAVALTLERAPTPLSTLARTHYLCGDLEKALATQRQALSVCNQAQASDFAARESFYRQVIAARQ